MTPDEMRELLENAKDGSYEASERFYNLAPQLLDIAESAEAVADFLKDTTIAWKGGSIPADQANIVQGLRAALAALEGAAQLTQAGQKEPDHE